MTERRTPRAHGKRNDREAGPVCLLLVLTVTALSVSCRAPLLRPGALIVKDAVSSADDMANGFLTTVDCSPVIPGQGDAHGTPLNTTSYGTVMLVNSGSDPVTIEGADILLLDDSVEPPVLTVDQTDFAWAWARPDFPILLAPGGSVSLAIAFHPTTGGVQKASLNLHTSDGDQQVRLTGEGGWSIMLSVIPAAPGRIVAPIVVTSGETLPYFCVESTLTLTAETTNTAALTELNRWTATGGASIAAADIGKLSTTAVITGNATINAGFYVPYIFVSQGGIGNGSAAGSPCGSLEIAVANFNNPGFNTVDGNGIPKYKGIVVSNGTYTLGADVRLPASLVRGGYAPGFGSRPAAYQTEAGRSVGGTRLNTGGYDFAFDGSAAAGITNSSLLEGFYVIAADRNPASPRSDNMYVAFSALGGASPTLRYNTFVGGGGTSDNSVGVYCFDSSPVIDSCVLQGGNVSASGGRSVGLWICFESEPIVTNDTIAGGTASDSAGKSYGIFNSSYAASPVIQGCIIDGGTGSSVAAAVWTMGGGRPRIENNTRIFTQNAVSSSNYGVYIGPNGRIDSLFGNNIYDCSTALVFDYPHGQKSYQSIDDVNSDFVTGDQAPNTSTAP